MVHVSDVQEISNLLTMSVLSLIARIQTQMMTLNVTNVEMDIMLITMDFVPRFHTSVNNLMKRLDFVNNV